MNNPRMQLPERRFGALIDLKPEFEERYLILHKHTFPGVLKQIRASGIRNYTIFLRDGRLFSYYEYVGKDFKGDMAKMRRDATTREWWKLTDPMQTPLEGRGPEEWWLAIPELKYIGTETGSIPRLRSAFRSPEMAGPRDWNPDFFETGGGGLTRGSIFQHGRRFYAYLESGFSDPARVRREWKRILVRIQPQGTTGFLWEEMKTAFHTG